MKPLRIVNGRLLDPALGLDASGSLLIEGGVISWLGIGEEVSLPDADVIPADGLIVCPGFIDLHCHLREPGFEAKETIASGAEAAARGGFTTVCCMPNTDPPIDSTRNLAGVVSAADEGAIVRVLPVACATRGRAGAELVDMAALASAGVVGFSDDGDPVADASLMRRALDWTRDRGLPVMQHCEDRELAGGGLVNQGVVSARLGLPGIPVEAEVRMVARDLDTARQTGGRLHICHVSTAGAVDLVRKARADGVRVTAEATPHHLTLTEDEVLASASNAKVNPPLRTAADVEAVVRGLADGAIDAIATDHAPHTEAEKARGLDEAPFGVSVLETALGSAMSLVHEGWLSLGTLVARLTGGPAAILGGRYGRLGTLAVGALADIVIFDPDAEWVVDTGEFASKGRNTPLAGRSLRGRVVATIAGGDVVYVDERARVGVSGPGG